MSPSAPAPRPQSPHDRPAGRAVVVPAAAALVVAAREAVWITADGEVETLTLPQAARRAGQTPPLVCHLAGVARRLGVQVRAFDVLELVAFVRPAQSCLPTPGGIADLLGLPAPPDREAAALVLPRAAAMLLAELASLEGASADLAGRLARTMAAGGWSWGAAVLAALGLAPSGAAGSLAASGLDVWNRLAEWGDEAPLPPPGDLAVGSEEARRRLSRLVGSAAEARPQQADYAAGVAAAFLPRDQAGAPNLVLAEAGTGVGKTLGYVAPASLWAEKNGGPVWISTYTKNLQRQVDQELDRLYPDPEVKRRRVVVRKGRENYLCLLNMEEQAERGRLGGGAVALGLMARWAAVSRDGDLVGGDFPSWLVELMGRGLTVELRHRRGECLYAGCAHYGRCFAEKSLRGARRADVVIANHALVMAQAVRDADRLPTRYVFDEGHHLFDAADSAYAAHLSGLEMAELRRWLRGGEGRRAGRVRGLERRIGEFVVGNDVAETDLTAVLRAAAALPAAGWLLRAGEGRAEGLAEAFLAAVAEQVRARAIERNDDYGMEAAATGPAERLRDAAAALGGALDSIGKPLRGLRRFLAHKLDADAATLDPAARQRIEAAVRSLDFRLEAMLAPWADMLVTLRERAAADSVEGDAADPRSAFVDWLAVERSDGRIRDVGLYRHWVDPTVSFASAVLAHAHGAVVTSATLRDRTRPDGGAAEGDDADDGWLAAEVRTGANHLPVPGRRLSVASPFDYPACTRVFVVGDVRRDDPAKVASAYRELFLAAGGGALGLFTAISRLRAVYQRIAGPVEAAGLTLLAQHVDALDTGTLVDIFRAERDSCLLGTDAVRDGVDVPGASLRLIVFDRVPWPRPDLLHRARREAFGARRYDEMLARLRLKQAYGRLIRRAGDAGVFVLLDRQTPTRLVDAFPEGVVVRRVGIAEAVAATRAFLVARGVVGHAPAISPPAISPPDDPLAARP